MKRRLVWVGICLLLLLVALGACDQPHASPTVEPGALLLSFERTGGIAGFQDRLAIGSGAEYHLIRNGQPERIGTLSGERRAQLDSWLTRWTAFTLTVEDNPGGPDNLKQEVIWRGTGGATPTQDEQREVLDWAKALLDELSAVKD